MGRWKSRTTKYKHIKRRKRIRLDRPGKTGGSRTTARRNTKSKVVPGSTKAAAGRRQSKGTKYRFPIGTVYHRRKARA